MVEIRVLHVEGDRQGRTAVRKNLLEAARKSKAVDLQLEGADTADQALKLLEKKNFDCVICDFELPDMNGVKFLQTMRNQLIAVPFVILTKTGEEVAAVQALRNGASDYWTKSESEDDFGTLLRRILNLAEKPCDNCATADAEGEDFGGGLYRDYFFDLDGIAFRADFNFRPIIVRGAFEKITGYAAEEYVDGSVDWDRIVHPSDQPWRPEMPIPGDCVRREYRIIRRDGKIRWVREVLRVMRGREGEPEYIQGFIQEIANGNGVGAVRTGDVGIPEPAGARGEVREDAPRKRKSGSILEARKVREHFRTSDNLLLICDSFVLRASLEKILGDVGIPFRQLDYLDKADTPAALARGVRAAIYACQVLNEIEIEEISAAMEMLPGVPVLVVCLTSEKNWELEAIRRGVRGSIKNDLEFKHIPSALLAVISGQLWFPRSIIQRVLDHYRLKVQINGGDKGSLLTGRQIEVLEYLAKGLSNREIAKALNISYATVVRHVYNIYRRMGVRNRLEALTYAARYNIVDLA